MKPDYSARKRGMPIMPIEERLKSSMKVNPVSGCWEWTGCKRGGYGHTIVGSRWRKENKMIDVGKQLQDAYDDGYKQRDLELVRCKDCKHYKTMFCKMDIWHRDITLYRADENDFCSYGERKDG